MDIAAVKEQELSQVSNFSLDKKTHSVIGAV